MKATIEDGCIGCGLCESVCPGVFRMTDEGIAEVYAEVTPENEACAFEAQGGCPADVIRVED